MYSTELSLCFHIILTVIPDDFLMISPCDPWLIVAKLWDCLHDYFSYLFLWIYVEVIQVQRNKVLIEEEQVELSLVDENVNVEHFFAMMHGS